MKKLFAWILLAACLALAACGGQPAKAPEPTPAAQGDYSTILTPEPTPEPAPEPVPAAAYEIRRSVANTWTDSIGVNRVQIIVEVVNTGTEPLYMSSCSMDLETKDGQLVAALNYISVYPQIIQAGERGVYYEETHLDSIPEGGLVVVPYLDIESATVPVRRLQVSDVSVSDNGNGGVKVLGRIENTEPEDIGYPYIAVLLYDKNGDCIGTDFTILTDGIQAGMKHGFEISVRTLSPGYTPDDVVTVEVFSYPHQYQ